MCAKPHPIYITVEGGLVQAVTNVLPGLEIVVVDYDVAGEPPQRLAISPLDGQLCCLSRFTAADSRPLEAA